MFYTAKNKEKCPARDIALALRVFLDNAPVK